MAEIKPTGPLPPPDWDLPDLPAQTDPSDPASSFQDDHVGSSLKHLEEARRRAVGDRFVSETPKRIVTEKERVVQTSAFRPSGEDEELRRAQRGDRLAHKRQAPKRAKRREAKRWAESVESDVEATEERIEQLMRELVLLDAELAGEGNSPKEGEEGSAAEDSPEQDRPRTRRQQLLDERRHTETRAKHHLQRLLAGGVGLSLAGDPRITFRRLLDRIARWPADVAPGHSPETDADFDAFLTWAFAPPQSTLGDLADLWSAHENDLEDDEGFEGT